ncbi:MAG TPA: PEP-CTERM sorting domain-containing protein [Verrucomicrobiae bacterium]|jgi:hypothetical protein
MKKTLLLSAGIAALLAQVASAQTVTNLINSWENSTEGWGSEGTWSSGGFSTTTGVTQGTYSWILTDSAAPDYSAALGGTASTSLTYDLAYSTAIEVDVLAGSSFGYQQWDLTLNNSVFGYQSADGYSFPESPSLGSESTLTFTVSPTYLADLIANPTSTTSINFQIGGSAAGTMEIDNLRIIDTFPVPEPSTLALAGLSAAGMLAIRRRKA